MNSINKEELLSKLETQVEKHLQHAIVTFQNLDTNTLLTPSASGGWSIAQCLEHLNLYSQYYLPAIEREIGSAADPDDNGVFKSTWFGSYFTKMMDPQTGKRKYKAFKGYRPESTLDAQAVVAEFISHQEKLLSLLRRARRVNLNTILIPVSIMKLVKMRLGDVFQFVIAHNERHVQQALRNIG